MRAVLLLSLLAVTPTVVLADFTGRVVKVTDGDTLTVLVNKRQVRVRLDASMRPSQSRPSVGDRSSR